MLYLTPALQLQMTRQPDLLRRIWRCLNEIDPAALLGEGRVYGGGLHKLGSRHRTGEIARLAARTGNMVRLHRSGWGWLTCHGAA